MLELVAIWFAGLIMAVVVVKRTEKPETPLSVAMYTRKHRHDG